MHKAAIYACLSHVFITWCSSFPMAQYSHGCEHYRTLQKHHTRHRYILSSKKWHTSTSSQVHECFGALAQPTEMLVITVNFCCPVKLTRVTYFQHYLQSKCTPEVFYPCIWRRNPVSSIHKPFWTSPERLHHLWRHPDPNPSDERLIQQAAGIKYRSTSHIEIHISFCLFGSHKLKTFTEKLLNNHNPFC